MRLLGLCTLTGSIIPTRSIRFCNVLDCGGIEFLRFNSTKNKASANAVLLCSAILPQREEVLRCKCRSFFVTAKKIFEKNGKYTFGRDFFY